MMNTSSSAVVCPNLLLALPLTEQFSSVRDHEPFMLHANATSLAEVQSNRTLLDEVSRFMELYMGLQAIVHFNDRDNTVVPIMGEFVNGTCSSLYVPSVAVSSSEDAFYDHILGVGSKKDDSVVLLPDVTCSNSDELLSIVGPMDSSVMEAIVKYSNDENMFQITPFSFFDDTIIENETGLKNFARSTTDAKNLAESFVGYLRFLKRDYIAILYDIDCAFCNRVYDSIFDSKGNLTIKEFRYSCKASIYDPRYCKETLISLQLSRFSTIVFLDGKNSYQDLDQIMKYSIEYGLVSKDHMWIIIPYELNDDYYIYQSLKCFPRGSKEELFVRGMSIYEYRNQFMHDSFEVELDSTLLPLIRSWNFLNLNEANVHAVLHTMSLLNAAYVYDTVIAMLFSQCVKSSVGTESSLMTLLKLLPTFSGATGLFLLDDNGNRANLEYSVLFIDDSTCFNGTGKGDIVKSDMNKNGTWISVAKGMYFDGNAAPPINLRIVNENMNYLTPAESWSTFVEVILIVCACALLSLFVNKFKDRRRVQLGQPFYLHSLCFYCALFSFHILPYGLDENNTPFGHKTLDTLCVMMPIVRSVGFLFMLYTVFIKLLVIWKELKYSAQVNYRAEFLSILIVIPITLVFGIVIISISSKYYRWNRFEIKQDEYSFTTSSKGQCFIDERMSTESLHFLITLLALVMTLVVYRKFEMQVACETCDRQYLINESKQIFVALAAHGGLNVATVSLLAFFNQTIHADVSRPFVASSVFPYLWFIVVQSLRSDNFSLSNDSKKVLENIIIPDRDDVSHISSITGCYDVENIYDEEGASSVKLRTTFDIMEVNVVKGVSAASSDCSFISNFDLG